ncbi:MAG TPA: hypothetical protein VJT50_08335 [Pyrinomonadaceae bacterium]|nr:hypothetical protein [Pyrinomonadaceae bacterium]
MRKTLFAILVIAISQYSLVFPAKSNTRTLMAANAAAGYPQATHRRRGDFGRRRHRGIRHAYANAGRSVGHGSRRFARHMRHGRPLHAGASFGRGMGGFGKHFGKGTARVGKRIAQH